MAEGKSWSRSAVFATFLLPIATLPTSAFAFSFTPGDLVISTVTGSALDAASPITLLQFALTSGGTSATAAGSFSLPQNANGANFLRAVRVF